MNAKAIKGHRYNDGKPETFNFSSFECPLLSLSPAINAMGALPSVALDTFDIVLLQLLCNAMGASPIMDLASLLTLLFAFQLFLECHGVVCFHFALWWSVLDLLFIVSPGREISDCLDLW